MGVVSGEMFVDGQLRDASFQRKTGYVQQQDLHLSTSTVREALNFSALLRQPANVSRENKLAYVDEVIKILEMEEYADAVVGVPGEGTHDTTSSYHLPETNLTRTQRRTKKTPHHWC